MKKRTARVQLLWLLLAGAAWVFATSLTRHTSTSHNVTITPLLSKELSNVVGKELSIITVEYPPGGTDPVHTHHAQAVVYVLEGSIVMQLQGAAPVTLNSGEIFYEAPDDVHIVGRNASQTAPAKFLVLMVKDKDAPVLTPVQLPGDSVSRMQP